MPTTATRAVRASRRDRRRSASEPFFVATGVIVLPPWDDRFLVRTLLPSSLGGEGRMALTAAARPPASGTPRAPRGGAGRRSNRRWSPASVRLAPRPGYELDSAPASGGSTSSASGRRRWPAPGPQG